MVRRIVSGIALTLVLATAARAQVPFSEGFKFVSGGTGSHDFGHYTGEFTTSANIGLTGAALNTPFQIWCVDPMQWVAEGELSTAIVTPFAAADFTNTLEFIQVGQTNQVIDRQLYAEAAYLAQSLVGGPNATDENLEYAIWTLMGYTGSVSGDFNPITASLNYNAGLVSGYIAQAQANYATISLAEWGVITNPISGHYEQEFIYHAPGGGRLETVVPEPATMSLLAMGLIGMAGATARRRKRQ